MRAAGLLVLLGACGRSNFDPPWQPGDPLPASCSGASSLEVTLDGVTTLKSDASSTLQLDISAVTVEPDTIVWLMFHHPPAGDVPLPDPASRIMYGDARLGLDTVMPTATNWNLAVPSGDVVYEQPGSVAGDRRCGWFDFDLQWMPVGASERSIHLRGTFDGVVRTPIAYAQ